MGTGLSDEELDAVVTKLKPYFRYFLDNLNTILENVFDPLFGRLKCTMR